ncbi:DUF1772 domain-containing protein [Lysobacter silvisoli]|uniref:DUF1772 domain-containing protein n=1 Tax=Lysobacter silvisoli TaxID=2293254 RepID=A0A371JY42_9GAMM|nr:anthrone oxygenase family protein [Lysobacter silvisoli]RDZ26589.1 DUF1772 domain-containing protein [Lysobacter silvisoli]
MLDTLTVALLWFAALGCALIGGLYFAFSAFIMRAFASIDPSAGIAAMNAINRVILRSLFMPLFWATTLAALALAGLALTRGGPGAGAMLAGGTLYLVGMFVCTVVFNVPLNNALQAAQGAGEAALPVWQRYLRQWTRWNHVRTVASLGAAALFVWVLSIHTAY